MIKRFLFFVIAQFNSAYTEIGKSFTEKWDFFKLWRERLL